MQLLEFVAKTVNTKKNTNMSDKKITLKDRKKAQPNAVLYLSDSEKTVIKETVARQLSQDQFKIFIYTCQALGLNPLLNEIACVTYKNKDGSVSMSIQVMRDGFLTIAHRSGKFAGIESGVTTSESGKILTGWAKVYHKDYNVAVFQEADFEEYNTGRNLWASKPKTMIKKVAESMALRKAFNVSGVYAPEEMEKELILADPKVEKELEETDAKKIREAKNTKSLIEICKKIKEIRGNDISQALMIHYNRKREELRNETA